MGAIKNKSADAGRIKSNPSADPRSAVLHKSQGQRESIFEQCHGIRRLLWLKTFHTRSERIRSTKFFQIISLNRHVLLIFRSGIVNAQRIPSLLNRTGDNLYNVQDWTLLLLTGRSANLLNGLH